MSIPTPFWPGAIPEGPTLLSRSAMSCPIMGWPPTFTLVTPLLSPVFCLFGNHWLPVHCAKQQSNFLRVGEGGARRLQSFIVGNLLRLLRSIDHVVFTSDALFCLPSPRLSSSRRMGRSHHVSNVANCSVCTPSCFLRFELGSMPAFGRSSRL